jgi:ribonuclease BN (tRNA processing enzyme)
VSPTSVLVVLGSGTAIPSAERTPSGHLVRLSDGSSAVLLDSGAGTAQRLARRGVRLDSLDAILYTHLHPDHTIDYLSIAFALKVPNFGTSRVAPIPVVGPPGFRAFVERVTSLYGDWMVPAQPRLDVRESGPGVSFRAGAYDVVARKTLHTEESQGYRLVDPFGAILAYSGDSDECDGLVDLARDADVFLCECSFPDAGYAPGHLTPSRAGRVAHEAGARRLVLTHLYPECADAEAVVREARRSPFRGEIAVARDGFEGPYGPDRPTGRRS